MGASSSNDKQKSKINNLISNDYEGEDLNKNIKTIKETVDDLKKTCLPQITQIKSDISEIKNDIYNMKSDISAMKQKCAQLNCNEIKDEISSLKLIVKQMYSFLLENKNNKEYNNIIEGNNINNNYNLNKKEYINNNNKINKNIEEIDNIKIGSNSNLFNLNNDNINNNNSFNNNNNFIIFNEKESQNKNNFNQNLFSNFKSSINNEIKMNIEVSNNPNNIEIKNEEESERKVTISMDGKNIMITINNNISFTEFKKISQKYFKINDDVKIYYINKFSIKKFIINEKDFKESLDNEVFIYYFTKENSAYNKFGLSPNFNMDYKININENKINLNTNNTINKQFNNLIDIEDKVKGKNKNDKNKNNFKKVTLFKLQVKNSGYNNNNNSNNNIINNDNNNNKININSGNNLINEKKEEDIEENKKYAIEVLEHFASCAFLQNEIKVEDFINSAVYVSYLIKQININEKINKPNSFHDIKTTLKYPGLISDIPLPEDYIFILSLIGKILEDKGIDVNIYKEKQGFDKLDGASLQYLFSGLTEKKKYEIYFELGPEKNNVLLQKGNELNDFIEEWKQKISSKLNINKNNVFLVNPKEKNGLCSLDFVSYEGDNVSYHQLKNFKEIKDIEEKYLIEGCQLNVDIFDPFHNNKDGGWGIGEKRGGEDYLPPKGWFGYGLKVSGKYDNGNNNWISYNNQKGEFAVAYFGLSNIYGNKKNLNLFLNEINSKEVLKMGFEQIYKNDKDKRNPSQKCGSGVYLFQNPNIAENTAGIIDIGGVRYKVLLMCRVNPAKIRQPEGFPDCWILNCTPSEIRPYRILIKKIFQSPMAGASQNEIKTFVTPSKYYKDAINLQDTSFFNNNNTKFNNNDFVINLYTSNDYIYINNYLREGKITQGKYNEKQIKSWIYCLNNALTKQISNVSNGSIYYRGV